MSTEVAHLELRVTSDGYVTAENRFGAAAKSAEVFERAINKLEAQQLRTEKASQRTADIAAAAQKKAADAADKASAAAIRAAERENEAWNNALQKAIARDEKRVESARRAADKIAEARKKENEASGFRGAALGLGEEIQKSIPGFGMMAGASAVGGLIASGMVEAVHATVEAAVQMENLKARLSGVTGGTESANKKFAELEEMTVGKLPFSVAAVTDAFIQLENVGLDGSADAMKSYANMAAQTGTSISEVASAVQAATLGNYRSLRSYGIRVQEEGTNLNITFRGHTETIRKSSEEIQGYLQKIGEVEFAGAAERQMDTVGGSIIKAKQSWEKLAETVASGPIGEFIATGMKEAAAATKLASDTFEGFMALMPKAQQMSEEASKSLAHFMDPKWGKADKDTTEKDWDAMLQGLTERAKSHSDKRAEQYRDEIAQIDELAKKAAAIGKAYDVEGAKDLAYKAYNQDAGGGHTRSSSGYSPNIGSFEQTGEARYNAMVRAESASTLVSVRASLDKREEGEQELYEHNKAILLASKGDETKYLEENEQLWTLYLAKLSELKEKKAAEDARKEEEFQKRIRPFGEGPRTTTQAINSKFAGQQIDLRNAFGDRLKDDASNPFSDDAKLAAQQQYKEKSVAIEKERVREINDANMQIAINTARNAEAMFGGLTTAAKNWGGQNSTAYKAMFAMQKEFSIAAGTLNMFKSISDAEAQPYPANLALMVQAAAQGAQVLAEISSVSYSGAHDLGGDIAAGSVGLVGEYGPEFVRGPARVTSRADTARMLQGGGFGGGGMSAGQPPNIVMHVGIDPHEAIDNYFSSTRGTQVFTTHLKKNWNTVKAIAGQR